MVTVKLLIWIHPAEWSFCTSSRQAEWSFHTFCRQTEWSFHIYNSLLYHPTKQHLFTANGTGDGGAGMLKGIFVSTVNFIAEGVAVYWSRGVYYGIYSISNRPTAMRRWSVITGQSLIWGLSLQVSPYCGSETDMCSLPPLPSSNDNKIYGMY